MERRTPLRLAGLVVAGLALLGAADGLAGEVVTIPVVREVGETHRLEFTTERERLSGTQQTLQARAVTRIDVNVLRRWGDGHIVRWTYGETDLGEIAGSQGAADIGRRFAERMANLKKGLALDLRTSESGQVRGLANKDDAVEMTKRAYQEVLAWLEENRMPPAMLQNLRQMAGPMLNPNTVEASTTREAALFYMFSGAELTLGERVRFEDLLPNPFGGEPLPSLAAIRLKAVDRQVRTATIEWNQIIDPEKAGPILLQSLAKLSGKPLPPDQPPPQIQINDVAEFVFDLDRGWPRSMIWSRTTRAGNKMRIDRKTIRMLPAD